MPNTFGTSGAICLKQESMTDSTPAQIATGFCSTQAGLGNVISTGTEARAKILLSRSTTIALVLVVPWSIARIRSGMGKKCGLRIAECESHERRSVGTDDMFCQRHSRFIHQQTNPPSTIRSTPVQKEAARLSKKTAGPTSSSTVAIRPSGVSASNCLHCSATSGLIFIGVSV